MPRSRHATGPGLVPATMRSDHHEPMSPSLIPPWSARSFKRDRALLIHRTRGLSVHDLRKGSPAQLTQNRTLTVTDVRQKVSTDLIPAAPSDAPFCMRVSKN